jgi:hypothetical protein
MPLECASQRHPHVCRSCNSGLLRNSFPGPFDSLGWPRSAFGVGHPVQPKSTRRTPLPRLYADGQQTACHARLRKLSRLAITRPNRGVGLQAEISTTLDGAPVSWRGMQPLLFAFRNGDRFRHQRCYEVLKAELCGRFAINSLRSIGSVWWCGKACAWRSLEFSSVLWAPRHSHP